MSSVSGAARWIGGNGATQSSVENFIGIATHSLDSFASGKIMRAAALETEIDPAAHHVEFKYKLDPGVSNIQDAYMLVYVGDQQIGIISDYDVYGGPGGTAAWRTFTADFTQTVGGDATITIVGAALSSSGTVGYANLWLDALQIS